MGDQAGNTSLVGVWQDIARAEQVWFGPTGGVMGFIGKAALAKRGLRLAVCGAALAILTACSGVYRDHGYVPIEEDLALVEVGKDTRDSVADKVGRPSASGLLNDTGWFYVRSRWQARGVLPAKEIDRQVVVISFDDGGTVTNVERFGLERGQVVSLSRRVTDTNIKGMGLIRQLLGSLGRVNAGTLLPD